jgi:hypothetical protein
MPITQIYIPLYVGFPRDPKVRALVVRHGVDGILAAYLYIVMALYCRENLSDGVVPVEEIGALAYPLPLDHAERLTKLLADAELIRGTSTSQARAQANGQAEAQAVAQADAWLVLAYVKRNGTREQAEQRAARLSSAGRTGGLRSRSELGGEASAKQRLEPGVRWSPSDVLSQSETETGKTSRARAGAHAPARGTRQPPPASEVLGQHYAPSSDPNAQAAEARRQLAERDRPLNAEPDAAPALGGEALARAQLAQARAARLPEIEAAAVDGDEPPAEQPPGDDYPF